MADFLLELLSEEIPARMQARARNDLARIFAEATSEAGLTTGAVATYSTPRRLVLIARDVAAATEAAQEELKGPRANAPEQALDGFLRKTGLTRGQLEERDGVLFAVIAREGKAAADVLAEAIRRIVADFPWPKSMRWGSGSQKWVRPLHGIVAMLGDAIVPVEVDGIVSGATTVGHRFHHPGPITVGGASDYAEKLRACHVIVDQDEREALIRDGAAQAAKAAKLALLPDEGLVVENAGLTEWPVPLVGRFDDEFLDVPREVIVLTMRTNQKYFACTGSDGLLAPAFVCVANIAANDGGEAIAQGNARVLAARLADARFFWEQDVKVPLEEQAAKVAQVVFNEKLDPVGTIGDKVERVAKLARWFAEEGVVKADANQVERAARLAKADLVSGMVGEFPELQGVMGGYIAEAQGESKVIAEAIRDHYKPVGQGDEVPSRPATEALAIADKLDTIAAFFGLGQPPTGSRDPFALRRAALGIIAIIMDNGLRCELREVCKNLIIIRPDTQAFAIFERVYSKELLEKDRPPGRPFYEVPEYIALVDEIIGFLVDRLKVQQREAGVRHDLIDAVFTLGGEDDLVRLLARVKALQGFVETGDGTNLLVAYKRAANILKKEKWDQPTPGPSLEGREEVEPEEAALVGALDKAEPKASAAIEAEDFTGAMAALASLRAPIDSFFDKVTVNDPDKLKRERRLNLLSRFRDAVNRVADFSRIEG